MRCKLTMLLGFLLLSTGGCGQATARQAQPPMPTKQPHSPLEPPAEAAAPAQTLADADALSRSRLGAWRAGQFEVDRQVGELRRAILLYQRFLDLADGRPEFAPAVKKSREAIVDLKAEVDFLLEGRAAAAGEPPPAQ